MTISTAVFGVYFHLTSGQTNNASVPALVPADLPAHVDFAWLALASMGVFITGEQDLLTHLDLVRPLSCFVFQTGSHLFLIIRHH